MHDQPSIHAYVTRGGVRVTRSVLQLEAAKAEQLLARTLDHQRGLWLASSFEYPGRYKRHDLGFSDPPVVLEARGRRFRLAALNRRGEVLLRACAPALAACGDIRDLERRESVIEGEVPASDQTFYEEARTRTPSVFSVLRVVCELFASPEDALLGLYGAFGYDLVFQFEALRPLQPRAADQRDLVLYLPDRLLSIDRERGSASEYSYDFELHGESTLDLPRATKPAPFVPARGAAAERDHAPGEYASVVERARQQFASGDLFEVTPSQVFSRPCRALPSSVFEALQRANPAPYGVLANLGDNEFLVGASPEMYVRVSDRRVETCPIAGTIGRGSDAMHDARQILTLLSSAKDEAELTMCTDVDRNDKARVCQPGSVRVIGRRQIELYSRLIHTVDHVEGTLRDDFDHLDAFLTHLWAVTVTGAPKLDAMQFIEGCERSPRAFYGGAVGAIGFDGSLDTGLTLRTLHIRSGIARMRAGATLHFDSEPAEEERETELKASALLAALEQAAAQRPQPTAAERVELAARLPVLLIDHRDSFVHTLADYLRQAGCAVSTLRYGFDRAQYDRLGPRLVVLSPGPARPDDFDMRGTFGELQRRGLPAFGVCLGLQGMVEFCGGRLARLETPAHGKQSSITCSEAPLFAGLPLELRVGRYHSLHAEPSTLPRELETLATTRDGCIMAVAHRQRPWWAVQFHPESILSADQDHGLRLIRNLVGLVSA